MSRPGVTIINRELPPSRSAPNDVGRWFIAALTEKGSITAPIGPLRSLQEAVDQAGARVSYGVGYDALETFFREGGNEAYIGRAVGPNPVKASHVFQDGAASNTLTVFAKDEGDWGNLLNVAFLAGDVGGEFKIQVTHDTDVSVNETSPSLVDKAALITYAANSAYIRVVDTGPSANDPAVVAAQSLTGGTDDRGNITDTQWKAALDRLPRDLGPGQCSMPGRTTGQAHTDTLAHAAANNRVALLDAPDTPTAATLKAAAIAARGTNGRYGGMFAPWAIVPGVVSGTLRTVPYSAVQAGLIARSDGLGGSPNDPAAGENGQAVFATGLSQPAWDAATRTDLNAAGVNVARVIYGGVRTYGYRALVDPVATPNWLQLSNVRMYMTIVADGEAIAERYVLKKVDGRRHLLAKYAGELVGMLKPLWEDDSLYGATAEEAFNVDVGPSVNTNVTIANNEVRAIVTLRISPFAEEVRLELVKVPITQEV